MPICKNCHKRINRFNKDRCPVCGVENPFEGMSSDTIEITTNIDVGQVGSEYHPCLKKRMLLYFCLIGITGIPFFYLKKKKLGFIELFSSLIIYAGVSLLFFFLTDIQSFLCGLIAFGVVYLLNISLGLIYYFTPNLKDGNGEFVI